MHEKNFKRIQVETIKIITETEKIVERLIETEEIIKSIDRDEAKTLSHTNLIEHKEILKNEKEKLDNLEYIVAVVGTMKAGKSMTINAIIGQEILPSREFPMTTLPTLIAHKAKQEKPILNLKSIEPFEKLVEKIKEKIEISKTSEQKDLHSLIDKIKNNKISFSKSYEGQAQIESFLKEINDLMRIAKDFDIEPPYEDFTNVDDLPRIEVEFYHLSKKENNSIGTLTLLDTPGPDEFKHSKHLKKIFKNQLERASAVMLLVDYTKMNSQSDVEVKEQVKDAVKIIGEKHLFVLLNKFDQRKRSDNTEKKKEEAKRLIAEDVLKDRINEKNIYPISAKSAFYANFGLRELDKNGKINTSLKWINDFGFTLLGEDWEDDINDAERIQKKCLRTWERSFFQEPLDNIIFKAHSNALSLSIESPLGRLGSLLEIYEKVFEIHQGGLKLDIDKLEKAIESLKTDIEKLSNISKGIEKHSATRLEKTQNKSEKKAEDKIKEILGKTLEVLNKQMESERKADKNQGRLIEGGIKLWDGGLFDIFKNDKKAKEEFAKKGKVTFDCESEAEEFLQPIKGLINKNIKNLHNEITTQIKNNLNDLASEINKNIQSELKDIIEEIAIKLSGGNKKKISIKFPQLSIGNSNEIDLNIYKTIDRKKVPKTRVRNSFLFGTLPNFFYSDWGKESYNETSYVVSKENLQSVIKEQFNLFKDTLSDNLNNEFDQNIKVALKDSLDTLIKVIEEYRHEQIGVLETRKKEDIEDIVKIIDSNNEFIKKVNILNKRVQVAKNELGENNES